MKKKIMLTLSLFVLCLLVSLVPVWAQQKAIVNKCPDSSTTMGTGDKAGTYGWMFRDINKACPELNLCEYLNEKTGSPSEGGSENIKLFATKEIDAGFVDEAVLELEKRADKTLPNTVKVILPLHYNSLHIIVLTKGRAISDGGFAGTGIKEKITYEYMDDLKKLKDKKIAAFASGVAYARLMNERLSLNVEIIKVDKKEDGFELLKKNEVYAFFAVGGFPIKWVTDMDKNVFTLMDINESDINKMQDPFKTVRLKYKDMPQQDGYNAISAKNVLVVKNYAGAEKVNKLIGLKECVASHILDFQENREAHPSWSDINPDKLDDFTWPAYEPKIRTVTPPKK